MTDANILESYRTFKRARLKLYCQRRNAELSSAGLFLFAGWLRLEEQARAEVECAFWDHARTLRGEGLPWSFSVAAWERNDAPAARSLGRSR